jgi:twinkle protein
MNLACEMGSVPTMKELTPTNDVKQRKASDPDYSEGDQVSLSDLRGSASLEQLSDNVIAIERNGQSEQPTRMLVRVLKGRETG